MDSLTGLPDFSGGYSRPSDVDVELDEPTRNQLLALQLMLDFGFDYDEWDDLTELWDRESDWLTSAANPKSSARGIPQAMTSLYPETQSERWLSDPSAQIRWGLEYIRNRYGSPAEALRHHDLKGWY